MCRVYIRLMKSFPGFMHHMVVEKSDGPTTNNLVTIAV
jgi:hypothetical protein